MRTLDQLLNQTSARNQEENRFASSLLRIAHNHTPNIKEALNLYNEAVGLKMNNEAVCNNILLVIANSAKPNANLAHGLHKNMPFPLDKMAGTLKIIDRHAAINATIRIPLEKENNNLLSKNELMDTFFQLSILAERSNFTVDTHTSVQKTTIRKEIEQLLSSKAMDFLTTSELCSVLHQLDTLIKHFVVEAPLSEAVITPLYDRLYVKNNTNNSSSSSEQEKEHAPDTVFSIEPPEQTMISSSFSAHEPTGIHSSLTLDYKIKKKRTLLMLESDEEEIIAPPPKKVKSEKPDLAREIIDALSATDLSALQRILESITDSKIPTPSGQNKSPRSGHEKKFKPTPTFFPAPKIQSHQIVKTEQMVTIISKFFAMLNNQQSKEKSQEMRELVAQAKSEFFIMLFSPLNKKDNVYINKSIIQQGQLDVVLHHLPINELSSLMLSMVSPFCTHTAYDNLIQISDVLNRRINKNPLEREQLEEIRDTYIAAGYNFAKIKENAYSNHYHIIDKLEALEKKGVFKLPSSTPGTAARTPFQPS